MRVDALAQEGDEGRN